MKVIFLDVSGVLISLRYMIEKYNELKRQVSFIELINPSRLEILKRIVIETSAKIVLCSDIRLLKDTDDYRKFLELLKKYDLFIYDVTPYINSDKASEIKLWLKEHPEVEKYVVIDDDISKEDNELKDRLIKPSYYEEYGLKEEHADIAIKILNN